MDWTKVTHYGVCSILLLAAAFAPVINATVPGVHIDPATASAAAVGVFTAGRMGPPK